MNRSTAPNTKKAVSPKLRIILLLGIPAIALSAWLYKSSLTWVADAEARVKAAQEAAAKQSSDAPSSEGPADEERKAMEEAAKSPQNPDIQLKLASMLVDHQHLVAAMDPAEKAVKAAPKRADARLMLGKVYATLGYLSDAEREYRESLRLNPDLLETYMRLGDLLNATKRPELVEPLFRTAHARVPGAEGPRLSLAQILSGRGKNDEALALLEPILVGTKVNPAAQFLSAKIKRNLGRTVETLETLKLLTAAQPNLAEAWHLRGSILANQGNLKEGVPALEKAVSIEPTNYTYHYALGNALRNDRSPDGQKRARAAFESAIDLNPGFAFAHYYYALTLEEAGETEAALREYRRTLEIEPKFGSVRHRLGALYTQLGRGEEGRKFLESFSAEAKSAITEEHGSRRSNSFLDTAEMQTQRGLAFLQAGQRKEAVECFRIALDREPGYAPAMDQLRKLGEKAP